LAKLLPNARLTVIAGAGHMPHHAHTETVIAAIARAALR
jgi:pimeloyl-ACP methyl ester carboxylesterase